jgi:hypothetical protein
MEDHLLSPEQKLGFGVLADFGKDQQGLYLDAAEAFLRDLP